MTPEQFFPKRVLELQAYHVPPAEGLIKLDAMENPYPWPESLKARWLEFLKQADLNRYPDPRASQLKEALRRALRIPQRFEILLGNGSDELIQILIMGIVGTERGILTPEPTFVMYRQIAETLGVPCTAVPLRGDFSLDLEGMLAAIEWERPRLIFLAYPNNPTGNLFDRRAVEACLKAAEGLVVIDEAYAPFTEATFLTDLERFPNLLVLRTLSKWGLAGLRIGYLIGAREWLEHFDKIRLPYHVGVLTQRTAQFVLTEARQELDCQVAEIKRERARLYEALRRLKGVEPFPSETNFILFRVPDADAVFEALKAKRILIKNLNPQGGLLKNCLRVTVGTPQENDAFLAALRAILGS